MNRDNFYIFDKKTKARSLLGEIQRDFNMSLTIDGTKDSLSCLVWGYDESEIEPYTICWHEKTDTWWVVSHDKVERYLNDSGFIYVHNLELFGAIELLNARDLTDCGYNDNKYTFGDFIYRLFKLSNYEYDVQIVGDDLIYLGTKVNFIKTFENYTLLSALREFLDAYNYSAKLYFIQNEITHELEESRLRIITKTGSKSLPSHTMSEFDDVRETKTMDKNSFGTCVVSNAENVISKLTKTFPSTGTVKCSSHEYLIKAQNAIIRLPSKVFKVNWLAMINTRPRIKIEIQSGSTQTFYNGVFEHQGNDFLFNPYDDRSFDRMIQFIKNNCAFDFAETFRQYIEDKKELLKETLKKAYTVKLYEGIEINPQNGKPIKGPNMPYMVEAEFYSHADNESFVLCDKDSKQCLSKTWTAIAWERGSDEITGFEAFKPDTGRSSTIYVKNFKYTDLQEDTGTKIFLDFENELGSITITGIQNTDAAGFHFEDNPNGNANVEWIVNYIPMSDIKIKVDNERERNDVKLYNQNGKLTDSFALSKLINSYAKEISSDTITKFMNYRNFNEVPKVGSFVSSGNEQYVINNVSLTFTQNENTSSDFGYFIEGEFTMSKYVATKSLMVNPNTNIRDYDIPQNYNVKRKQVYRDYYELSYSHKEEVETLDDFYLSPYLVFRFGHNPNTDFNFVCVIRAHYDRQVNGAKTYYYQLETTVYDLNKMFYILLDFKDNNIIGYGSQTSYAGFVLNRIIDGTDDTINVPISYVDSEGEIKDLTISFVSNKIITTAYYNYLLDNGYINSYNKTLYNYSVFIPQYIYTYCTERAMIYINEQDYKKDALEVPVFEYACQCEDTPDVLVGDEIFRQHDNNFIYFYSFVEGENLTVESVSTSRYVESLTSPLRFRILDSARISFDYTHDYPMLKIRLFSATTYNIETQEWEDFTQNNFVSGKDYAIFRHAYNKNTGEEIKEKILIAKSVRSAYIDNNGDLIIYLNHYQLK